MLSITRFNVLSLLIVCVLAGKPVSAQDQISAEDKAKLVQLEDSLVVYADSLSKGFIPTERIDFCATFTGFLKEALSIPGSAYYPFDKLKGKVHILYPEDRSFRVFNWLLAPSDFVRRYYGVIQMMHAEPLYYPMIDFSEELYAKATSTTQPVSEWYGSELYRILTRTDELGTKRYFLFGFSSNGLSSNKKILDVLTFTQQGPIWGAPIFMVPDAKGQRLVQQTRMILEYKKSVQASLNYDESKQMIVFNRLISEINDYRRKSTFIPSGQTDGLRWESGKMVYVRDAMPVLKLQNGQAPIDGVMNNN